MERRVRNEPTAKGTAIRRTDGGSAAKKHAKKAAKHAKKAAKHAAKKHAKKAAKHVAEGERGLGFGVDDRGLMTAFHHMQRASVVISLMEKGTGGDLRDLLERGVKLYRKAAKGGANEKVVLRAIGVLRAAEHLAMAGLYVARNKHRQRVETPAPKWLKEFTAETEHRLERIEHEERGKGVDLLPVTVELLRQAEDADEDHHLAFELVMAADALCFALESGL
jgi:hypothetical protein